MSIYRLRRDSDYISLMNYFNINVKKTQNLYSSSEIQNMSGEITVSMKMLILSNNNQNSCKYIIMKNNNVNRHIRFTATSVREEVIFEVMPILGKS